MNSLTKFVFILILCFSIHFIESSVAFEQMKTHTVADGLVGPIVPVIFQDSRGTLWLGSGRGGITRFDGKTFVPYTAIPLTSGAMPASFVQAGALLGRTRQIVEDKWGHIWFLTRNDLEETGQVSRFDGTSIELIGTGNLLIVDRRGDVWVSENQWLTKYVTSGVQKLPEAHQNAIGGETPDPSTETLTINVIFESEDGTLWLGGSEGTQEKSGVILSFRENPQTNVKLSDSDDASDKTETETPRIQQNIGFTRYDTSHLNVMSAIEAVTGDAFGNLWFGGYNLLLKFDGETFNQVLPLGSEWSGPGQYRPPRQASIRSDSEGRLWFNDGRITKWWDGSQLQTDRNVQGVLEIEDEWGNLWFTNESGEVNQYDETLKLMPFSADDGLGVDRIHTIFEAINGDLWFGHDNGVTVFNPKPAIQNHGTGIGSRVGGKSRLAFWTDIVKIFEVGGYIWFINEPVSSGSSTRYTFFRYRNELFDQVSVFIKPKPGQLGRLPDGNPKLFVTEEEHRWMAFGGHIFKIDATGLLWFTNRFQRIPFQTTLEIEHTDSPINALHTDANDKLWVIFENGRVESYPKNIEPSTSTKNIEPEPLPYLIKVTKMLETPSGAKWFFNVVTGKLIRWNVSEPGKPIVLKEDSRVAPLGVWQNPTERNEEATFLFPDVLKTYRGQELVTTEDIELAPVNASLTSQDGVLWLATSRGAVRYDGRQLTAYRSKKTSRGSRKEGFLVDRVHDVIEDSNGSIWFATKGGGTVRYDGETFDSLTTKDGLAHNNISKIYESSDKDIWFATEGGVTQYTPTRGGLPFYRLTALKADKVYTGFSSDITLPAHGNKHIIFYVRGISPLRERLSYEFKIIGLDSPGWTKISAEEFSLLPTSSVISSDEWFPASGLATRQVTHNNGVQQEFQNQNGVLCIRYTGLKAGTYSFIVKAFRKDWPYTHPPAVVDFSIPSPFWTQWRAYLPTLMFGTVVLALIGRLFINRRHTVQLRNEMLQKEEAEILRIRAELNEAQNIQMGLLPTESPDTKEFDIAGMSVPATQVGGDFYDYVTVANGKTAIAVADAAGKGLRGAMNAVLTNGMLHEVARFRSDAGIILTDLNAGLAPRMYGPSFIALNLAVLNESEKRIDYSNGGQPYPILKRGTEIIEIENSDLPLGSMKSVQYESIAFDLAEGDMLIFHSDGLIEALNSDVEMYGTDRLKAVTSQIPNEYTAEEVIQHIVEDVHGFVEEAEQYDDLTLVVVKRISVSG